MNRFPINVAALIIFSIINITSSVFAQNTISLQLNPKKTHDLEVTLNQSGVYEINITGNDPYIFTQPFDQPLDPARHQILAFEYFSLKPIGALQIFMGPEISENNSITGDELGSREGWSAYSVDLQSCPPEVLKNCPFFRLDWGGQADRSLQLRSFELRPRNEREEKMFATYKQKQFDRETLDRQLAAYLTTDYPCTIERVEVDVNKVSVQFDISQSSGSLFLAEIPIYIDSITPRNFDVVEPLPNFETQVMCLPRYVSHEGKTRDRLLSRWAIVGKTIDDIKQLSHARYADQIQSKWDLPEEKPASKKGLGGFVLHHVDEDIEDLGISSVTVNLLFDEFMRNAPSDATVTFSYHGHDFYLNKAKLEEFDRTLKYASDHHVIVAAILLVSNADKFDDPKLGKIFEHPDYHPAGIYTMPNLTDELGVEYYSAFIDFLAQRYSRPDKKYGRIHHWIMHNEVDAAWVWTNAGEQTPLTFMNQYHKSMRIAYNIVRQYNPHSKTFISLTHFWNDSANAKWYKSRELLDILLDFSRSEGDFEWAIAYHPYPQDLNEPKSWLDTSVTHDFDTPLITYKNIEVLDAWVKQPRTMYLGCHRRTVYLSEQGLNSRDYSQKSLEEQAAGMAYAWKKLEQLDGIDAFQYHNWVDNREEGGLRIGLRRFPDDAEDPYGPKPIWHLYQKLGTSKEDQACEFAKPIIGIKNWDEIF